MTSLLSALLFAGTIVIQTVAGGASPNDWTSSFDAVWLMEEATNNDRLNETATTCGSDCDLLESSGDDLSQDSTNYVEGAASVDFVSADTDYLYCDWSTPCEELRTSAGGDVSWGGWFRPDANCSGGSGGNNCRLNSSMDSGTDGILSRRLSSDGTLQCLLDFTAGSNSTTTFTSGDWYAYACTYANDADDELLVYIDGADEDTTPATLSSRNSVDAVYEFIVGGPFEPWGGQQDEVWIFNGELTAAQVAHIGACGIDGALCVCDGTTYTDEGRSDSECTGIGTPYKCCTGSGTGCIDNALLTGDCNASAP